MFPFQPAREWEFKYRIVIVFLSIPIMAWLAIYFGATDGRWFAPKFVPAFGISAVVLGTFGLFLRLWGTETLSISTMLKNKTETESLVQIGPFGVTRNPLYSGTLLILAAFSLHFGWITSLIFFLFHAIRFHRIVLYEEEQMSREHAEEFAAYQQNVPRWWPRLKWPSKFEMRFPSLNAWLSNGPFVSVVLGFWLVLFYCKTLYLFPFLLSGLLVTGLFLLIHRIVHRS